MFPQEAHKLEACKKQGAKPGAKRLLLSCLFAAGLSASSFLAFPEASMAQSNAPQGISMDVTALENRYFFHQYQHDPIEKRLERLELLVFGSAQGGASQDRLARLKATIVQRDKQAAHDLAAKNRVESKSKAQDKTLGPAGSSQYPVLNTLEWRVLKKTHPTLSLDERLSQLETHLFGQPSPAMSYADRVERLQKTIGLGISRMEPMQQQALPQGPLPKAQGGRGLNPSMPFYDAPSTSYIPMPPLTSLEDFRGLDDASAAKMHKRMNDMLKHFSNMMGVPFNDSMLPVYPGVPNLNIPPGFLAPTTPVVPQPEKGVVPDTSTPADQSIPPYADPNSI